MKIDIENNPYFLVSTVWYSRFQIALSEKRFEMAEKMFLKYQYWKRRSEMNDYLTELSKGIGK